MYERGGISSYDDKAAGGPLGRFSKDGQRMAQTIRDGDWSACRQHIFASSGEDHTKQIGVIVFFIDWLFNVGKFLEMGTFLYEKSGRVTACIS